jgi:hypothetical protein
MEKNEKHASLVQKGNELLAHSPYPSKQERSILEKKSCLFFVET